MSWEGIFITRRIVKDENDLFRDEPKSHNKTLRLSLPLPPSVNHMYVNSRGGGKRLTRFAEDYIRISRALINEALETQHWIVPERETWMYCDAVFFMPDRRIRDSHNMLKLLLDVMQGTVFVNDYFVMPRIQGVEYDADSPRVEVLLSVQTKNQREKGLRIAGIGL